MNEQGTRCAPKWDQAMAENFREAFGGRRRTMPEQTECRKFRARLEVMLNVDVPEGSVEKFWANNLGMVRKLFEDTLSLHECREFERSYGDGVRLKMRMTDVDCTSVGEV